MRVEKRDGSLARQVLTAMVVDDTVLGRLAAKWPEDPFNSRWENTVAKWCVDFHRKYDKAPGSAVEGLFAAWAEGADRDTARLVEKYLADLSGEYARRKKQVNPDYVTDAAAGLFNRVRIGRLLEAVQGDIDAGDVAKAQKRLDSSRPVEVGAGTGTNVLNDPEALKAAFKAKAKPLITLPGAAGNFFRNHLARDCFVSFMAPEKCGKSFWLQELGWQGMLQGHRVAWFAVGDMSRNQMMVRMASRASKRPYEDDNYKWPTSIEPSGGGKSTTTELEDRVPPGPLTAKEAWKAMQGVYKKLGGSELLRMDCHPSDTVTVNGIEDVLNGWERRDGWAADVVVVDYADLLAPVNGLADTRDQINQTWKRLRSLAMKKHCLVVTATQVKASAYKKDVMDKSDFANDKRKFAEVTAMIAVNQKEEEKEAQIQRLNYVVLREGDFRTSKCLFVANCLAVANPLVLSTF